jgi:hypothetical protein
MCTQMCHLGIWTWKGAKNIVLVHDFMDTLAYNYPYRMAQYGMWYIVQMGFGKAQNHWVFHKSWIL